MDIKKALEKIDEMASRWDDDDYHGSALHSASKDDPRDQPCPTCGEEDVLTRRDVAQGYQCDTCADRAEGKNQYESKKPSLKDYFHRIDEDTTSGMKPLPMLDPKNQQVGAAVITSKNPTIQKILKNLTPQDVQVVQTMAKTGSTSQSGTQSTGTTTGTTTGSSVGSMQPMKESNNDPVINGKVVDLGSLMIADVYTKDYPDFADAYVESGSFEDGTEMSDAELEEFQEKYGHLVNQLAHDSLYEENINEISKKKVAAHVQAADKKAVELGRQGMEKYRAGDREGGASDLTKSGKYHKMASPHSGLGHKKLAGTGVKVPATGPEPGEVKYVITKVGRTPGKKSGLGGQTIQGVTIKDVYTDKAEAQKHADHLGKYNPVGYEVIRIFDEGVEDQKLGTLAREIEMQVAAHFPDSEGLDAIMSKARKIYGYDRSYPEHMLMDLIDAAAKKHLGSDDFYSYVEDFHAQHASDNPENMYEQSMAEGKLNEKWGTETKVSPSEKGKYKGKTKAELLKHYNKLKKSGPHKKGSKEYGTMRELSFAIRAKSGWGKVKEAERPSDQVDMGAGLGAGRSNTVLESNMKKTCQAAYHEGKSHGLGGHAYTCRYDEGTDEHMHYHKGFKEGLDECYGIDPMRGVVDEEMRQTVPGMADQAIDECGMMEDDMDEGLAGAALGGAAGAYLTKSVAGASTGAQIGSAIQDKFTDLEEMNKTDYMKHMAKKTPGDTFKAFGQTFSDDEVLESDYTFESLDKQLSALLNEDAVAEGISVSISKGQQGGHDSVSVTATDAEADNLLALVKNAGMGIFADDQKASDYGAPVSHDGHAEVEDHDSILGIMKKMAGIQDSHDSRDYKQEDDSDCGCGQTPCGCEEVTEEESEDQMEYEVAEDATEVAMTNADEEAEAAEDQAIATADAANAEEDELNEWANDAMKRGTEEAFTTGNGFMTDTISGGLNKKKSTGQTTIPVITGQSDRMGYNESFKNWIKLVS